MRKTSLGFVLLALLLAGYAEERMMHLSAGQTHSQPENKHVSHNTNVAKLEYELAELHAKLQEISAEQQKQQEAIFEEAPLPPVVYGAVPPAIRLRWTSMQAALMIYYNAVRPTEKLDSRYDMFSFGAATGWMAMAKELVQGNLAGAFKGDLIDIVDRIQSGHLAQTNHALNQCAESAQKFIALTETSNIIKGIVTIGVTALIKEAADLKSVLGSTGTEAIEQVKFETVDMGKSVLVELLNPPSPAQAQIIQEQRSVAVRLADAGNATARVGVDALVGVLTLGILPLSGWVLGRVVRGVESIWSREQALYACILGGFAAMTEGFGIHSSVGAQGVQYLVKDHEQVVLGSGELSDLLFTAMTEYHDPSVTSPLRGIVSSEDLYQALKAEFSISSKVKTVATVATGVGSGISETIRQYALGNDYEAVSKMIGTSLVAFLKNFFWKEVFTKVTQGLLPLDQAGLVKDLVVTGAVPYVPVYTRYHRVQAPPADPSITPSHSPTPSASPSFDPNPPVTDYAEGKEYADSYGCGEETRKCWTYCFSFFKNWSMTSGAWCYAPDPEAHKEGIQLSCETKRDCYNALARMWPTFKSIPCAGACTENHWDE